MAVMLPKAQRRWERVQRWAETKIVIENTIPGDEGFPVLTEEQLDEMLAEPIVSYDPAAVDKLLDEIARLQGDGKDGPDMMAIFWDNYEASEAASEADDNAFERDLMARLPHFHEWPLRERERAIRAGQIPDEPVDDEDDEELPERYDDLAS